MMRRGKFRALHTAAWLAAALVIGAGVVLVRAGSSRYVSRPAPRSPYAVAGYLLRPPAFAERPRIGPQRSADHGAAIYQVKCSLCHGADLKGVAPGFPSLLGVTKRLSDAEITSQIRNGKGRMLAFPDLSDDDLHSLLLFLKAPPNPARPSSSKKPGA